MLDKTIADAIVAEVDRAFDAQVAFTQDLVRFPSIRGAEHTCQDFMAQAMHRRGFAVDHWKIDVEALKAYPGFSPVAVSYDNAYNVVGTYRPASRKGRSLILNGHVDVVPVGPLDRWTTPPFEPRIENGWMYGRGAGDMKAGVAAMLFAYDAIRAAGYAPTAPIHFESVVEEEATGNGTLACAQRGYKADCALIPEPLGSKLLRAQVGLIWFRVHVPGDPQHASGFQTTGGNAIEKAIGIWQELKELEKNWNARKAEHPIYRDHPHPIRFNLGNIAGGEWTSSVPAACTIDVRVGVYPGWSVEKARAEIEACVRKASLDDPVLSNNPPTVEYHGHMSTGYVLENAEAPERALAESHLAVFGEPMQDYVTSASSDARVFGQALGFPALVYGPVCERAHGFDERVDLASVRRATKTIALFVASWCGVEKG